MGTQKRILLNTHFRLLNMGSVNAFLCKKFLVFASFFCASVSTLFDALFRLCNKTLFGVIRNCDHQIDNSDYTENQGEAKEQEVDVTEFEVAKENDDLDEDAQTPKFFFKFQFQNFKENYEPVGLESVPSTSTNKYEFLSGKDFSHYLEEPEAVNFTVKEFYADANTGSICNKEITNEEFLSDMEFVEQKAEAESIEKKVHENSADAEHKEELGKVAVVENNVLSDQDISRIDVQFLSEKDLIDSDLDSDSDSITSSHEFMSHFVASTSDGFLSDKDFEDVLWEIDEEKLGINGEGLKLEDTNFENVSSGYEPDDFEEEDSDLMEELQKLEEPYSGTAETKKLSEKEFQGNNLNQDEHSSNAKQPKNEETVENSEKSPVSDSEDSNGLEILWEHQDLIEQLKMELKKVRATGLPTILEEDECPKMMEDLKPWKIDEKFQHEDKMGELHKFYRSYRERMRKFDILNYQKMYAMGFLQSKDPLQSISSYKSSLPALTSFLSQKFLLGKPKKLGCDPMMSFIRELHGDLEMVYVGQMCLSWEILHWQYEKAIELWESDPYLIRRYNEVAGEFQQFQVLMQRFIENEPFEAPRVQNYVKNRCILRNLLQVPAIREDSNKDKKARRKGKDDYTITSDMLVEIMEESIRIFWRFVRADKDAHNVTHKARKGTQIEPQDPTELELLTEVRTSLQKKEKKLKDISRSGNCILRKFQKHQEDSSDHVLYFFSQVDMKLVSRVLNMSKITVDQLLWCHNKLSKINFVSRKIHVDPSFLLFPC